MSELNGRQNLLFGNLRRAGFHHDDAAFGARDHDVDLGFARFRVCRIGDAAPVDQAHAHATQDVSERNIRDGQRGAGADHGQRRRILLGIGRQHHGNDLRLVGIAFGEQRPDRPVNQAAGQDFFFRGPAFAFNESAWKLSGGISVFTIIHREREKGGVRLGFFVGTCRYQNGGVSGADNDRSVRLPGDPARLQRNFLTV